MRVARISRVECHVHQSWRFGTTRDAHCLAARVRGMHRVVAGRYDREPRPHGLKVAQPDWLDRVQVDRSTRAATSVASKSRASCVSHRAGTDVRSSSVLRKGRGGFRVLGRGATAHRSVISGFEPASCQTAPPHSSILQNRARHRQPRRSSITLRSRNRKRRSHDPHQSSLRRFQPKSTSNPSHRTHPPTSSRLAAPLLELGHAEPHAEAHAPDHDALVARKVDIGR